MNMRDIVISRILENAKKDRDIVFLNADMGAPALDAWRTDLPEQYIDVGIAEQCMASVAAGMSKAGKKPFIYAIAPFVVSRIHEFHKVNAGIQNIPYNVVAVGAGFGYGDSGPTHHNTEDIALMRAVPNMTIYSPSDADIASEIADEMCRCEKPIYLRLERGAPQETFCQRSLNNGYSHSPGSRFCIVTTGAMITTALKARDKAKELGMDVGIVDVFRIKPFPQNLLSQIAYYDRIVVLEEHLRDGGLGSILCEMRSDAGYRSGELIRMGVKDQLVYLYGRDNIHRVLGLNAESVVSSLIQREWPSGGLDA